MTDRLQSEKALQRAHENLGDSLRVVEEREREITRLSEMADLLRLSFGGG